MLITHPLTDVHPGHRATAEAVLAVMPETVIATGRPCAYIRPTPSRRAGRPGALPIRQALPAGLPARCCAVARRVRAAAGREAAVSEVRQRGSVRTTAAVGSVSGERVIAAGTRGTVLEARPDGTCLAVVAFAAQTADWDGGFAQAVRQAGQ